MKVAVVGSRTLPTKDAVAPLFKELLKLPDGAQILIREPKRERIGEFEELTAKLSRTLGYQVLPMRPAGAGREGVWERDMAMIEAADLVLAFFDTEHIMQGGTGHVVEKAIEKEVPTEAFEVTDTSYHWIGGTDSDILGTWPSHFLRNSSAQLTGGSTSGQSSGPARSRRVSTTSTS